MKASYFNRLVNHINRITDYMKVAANSADNCKEFFTLSADSLF